jgi:hypothetical protein
MCHFANFARFLKVSIVDAERQSSPKVDGGSVKVGSALGGELEELEADFDEE